jgi:hypothetical protein
MWNDRLFSFFVAAAGSSSGATIMKAKSAIITAALLGPNLKQRLLLARDWASVRKSPDVDAYVLAWIASQVRFHSPQSQPTRASRATVNSAQAFFQS